MSEKVYKEAEEAEDKAPKGKVAKDVGLEDAQEQLFDDNPGKKGSGMKSFGKKGSTRKKAAKESAGESDELRLKLEAKELEAAKNNDLYLRALADLENYKIRAKKEREEYVRHANDRVISELLGIVDNMERALEHSDTNDDFETLSVGVKHIRDNMLTIFASLGLKPIEAVGTPFDPNLHEAISHEESSEFAPDMVIREFKKGYYLNDRLLRPATVSVAKAKEAE